MPLSKSAAFVVGPRNTDNTALLSLARGIGFSPAERYSGMPRAEEQLRVTPLAFFLFSEVPDVRTLRPVAEAVRLKGGPTLKFAPLIYFGRDLSRETITHCIAMGFDDVIALPYSAGDVRDRLARQLGSVQVYFETATYFGPDRRNRVGAPRSALSDHGGGEFRRIEIVRSGERGIEVLRDDFEVVV